VPVAVGAPLIVYEVPVGVPDGAPVTPVVKVPPVLEITAELVVVYTIGVIVISCFTLWVGLPLVPTCEIVGMGFTVPVTGKRDVDTQPVDVFRDCA
jgi:hypothetical protein